MTGVRYRDDAFEGRCDYCREWWPITEEFWYVSKSGFRKCRACVREYHRRQQADRRMDPVKRDRDRLGVQAMRDAYQRAGILKEYRHRWYVDNRDRILANRRARYAKERLAAGLPYTPRGPDSEDHPARHAVDIKRLQRDIARRKYKAAWQRAKREAA